MKITVLGCGDAFSAGGRFHTSFLLATQGRKVLVDCGASALIRMRQLEILPTDIDTIVITHFHGDHYGGLPFLLLSYKVECSRQSPLTIIGPQGLKERVYALQDALYPGTSTSLNALDIEFIEFGQGKEIKSGNLSIEAYEVKHSPPSMPHGVRIADGAHVFGFSGDSEWHDHLSKIADGADLFIIDSYHLDLEAPGHMSYKKILENKHHLNAKRILLSHMGEKVLQAKDLQLERLYDGMEIVL